MKWYSTPSPNLSPYIFLGLDPSPPPLPSTRRVIRVITNGSVLILASSLHIILTVTGWPRPIGCLIFIGHFPQKSPHFPQKSPIINDSSAKSATQGILWVFATLCHDWLFPPILQGSFHFILQITIIMNGSFPTLDGSFFFFTWMRKIDNSDLSDQIYERERYYRSQSS